MHLSLIDKYVQRAVNINSSCLHYAIFYPSLSIADSWKYSTTKYNRIFIISSHHFTNEILKNAWISRNYVIKYKRTVDSIIKNFLRKKKQFKKLFVARIDSDSDCLTSVNKFISTCLSPIANNRRKKKTI